MASVKLIVSLAEDAVKILRERSAEKRIPASRYLSELIFEDDRRKRDRLADEGYRLLSADTRQFAAAALPLAAETWPDWLVEERDDERAAAKR